MPFTVWLLVPPFSLISHPSCRPQALSLSVYSSCKILIGTYWKVHSLPFVRLFPFLQHIAQVLPSLWRQRFSHLIKFFLFPQLLQFFPALITFTQPFLLSKTISSWQTGTVSYLSFHPLEHSRAWNKTGGPFIFKFEMFNDFSFCL